jgi:hypothetical protein
MSMNLPIAASFTTIAPMHSRSGEAPSETQISHRPQFPIEPQLPLRRNLTALVALYHDVTEGPTSEVFDSMCHSAESRHRGPFLCAQSTRATQHLLCDRFCCMLSGGAPHLDRGTQRRSRQKGRGTSTTPESVGLGGGLLIRTTISVAPPGPPRVKR